LIKTSWTLNCGGRPEDWVEHRATPDGCVEIIRRLSGRSIWNSEQPDFFVAGLITTPALLRFSGDARFAAIRLWPWAWNQIGPVPASALLDSWLALDIGAAPDPVAPLQPLVLRQEPIGSATFRARTVADLAAAVGQSHRTVQRWFAREIGLPPRLYLRLLRFQDTLAGLQHGAPNLADHAAAHGYADQAHMARDFRALAGTQTRVARRRARGPFV
jgi:AraC-like DNA-binding protein